MTPDAREQDRHNASVMIAYAEGKGIRSRFKTHPHPPWIDDLNPRWDFVAVEYEVKPEERKPREFRLFKYPSGGISVHTMDDGYSDLAAEVIHVIEVLPETETE